jgi:molybdopterin-guanine dinucleotide biosynthesis protein A
MMREPNQEIDMIPIEQITGLVLAGGRGMRMGQVNKGLQLFKDEAMVAHVIRRLTPQVAHLMINVNQDIDQYAQFSDKLITDLVPNYAGPLAGLHAGLSQCTTPFLATVPCDSPFIPSNLVEKLAVGLNREQAQIAIVVTPDNERSNIEESKRWQQQPVFCLLRSDLTLDLENFLKNGGRKVSDWYSDLKMVEVAFENCTDFRNINTKEELTQFATESA